MPHSRLYFSHSLFSMPHFRSQVNRCVNRPTCWLAAGASARTAIIPAFCRQVVDSLSPSVRSGNLSVLRRHWEEIPCAESPPPASPQRARHDPEEEEEEVFMERAQQWAQVVAGASRTPVVPSSPAEKPSVPLNSLKMMFERGGSTPNRVSS